MKKKHIMFLVFKLIGVVGIVLFVIGIIKLVNGFGEFEDNSFSIGMFMMPVGLFLGVTGLVMGFRPEITKHTIKTIKYIQKENQEELKEIVSTVSEIHLESVTATANAVRDGLSETIYCKHCGKRIDLNSQFCKYCGQKL